ncbi:hypothetical protein B0H11DRAFT_2018848 [Mycena galericulata]|nr:hypothetical protein B0H11DRAFT_2018848 [Mycena galericulata]
MHRFRLVLPLTLPHAALASVEYRGYIIPKGTTIFPNACKKMQIFWRLSFRSSCAPVRYLLTENGIKPRVDGRDLKPILFLPLIASVVHCFAILILINPLCPGIHLAQNSAHNRTAIQIMNVRNLLWAFNFDIKTLDMFVFSKEVATGPIPFKGKITPRTAEKADIICHESLDAADTFSKFEFGLSPKDKEFVTRSRAQDRQNWVHVLL